MTRHGQVWEAILKATFTTFCDLSDIRTKARLSVREIIIRAVKRDQTFARRLKARSRILLNILVTTIFRPILSRAIPTKEKGFAISGQYGQLPL